ncbi:MAG: hypothetical protein ABSD27_03170 [Bryobacteraceae bacterium]
MKAVQVGILVALLVCAGLLFKIYRGQQVPATPVATETQPAAPAAPQAAIPAAAAPAAAVATAPETAARATAAPPAAPRKPSPTRTASRRAGETMAENRAEPEASEPAAPPAAAVPAPSAAPAPAPVQVEQTQPPGALNPPSGAQTAPPEPRQPHKVTIPAGTPIVVRLSEALSSDRNQAGDTFSAALDQPLVVDGFEIAARGARVEGKVVEAQPAGRVRGVSSLAVQLVRLHTADGQDVTISTRRFAQEGGTSHGEDAKKVGVGAAIGAAIGAIAGGGKGAAIGAGVGGAAGAGTVAATRGKPTELAAEARLTFRLEEPVPLTERIR